MAAAASAAPSAGRRFHKVIILGESQVGKSALVSKLRGGTITTISTVGVDFVTYTCTGKDGEDIGIDIWDTAGQERFQSITKTFIRDCSSAMLVYDVTDNKSFAQMHDWGRRVRRISPGSAIVLVGNKVDLASKRQVKTEMGHEMAMAMSVPFLETSAKSGHNVKAAFSLLAETAAARAAAQQASSTRKLDGRVDVAKSSWALPICCV